MLIKNVLKESTLTDKELFMKCNYEIQENKKYAKGGVVRGRLVAFAILLILAAMMFVGNVHSADKVIVDTTRSGRAIFEDAPDYVAMRAHYLKLVSASMEKLVSDSLDQETIENEIANISLQCVFANRLPDAITLYDMVSMFTNNPDLRTKLVILISNTVWLRQDNAVIVLDDNRRFNLSDRQWYYQASEAEIRSVYYNEVICLVMGVEYVAPAPIEHITVVEPLSEKKSTLPGYSTVE